MSLIVIIGAQAVGKMTVGMSLEKKIDGKLLFNHQTIDLFADYLGYGDATFKLSDQMRKGLFEEFVKSPSNNRTKTIIFTVLIDFNQEVDIEFLEEISDIFLNSRQKVYFVELVADLKERLKRNAHEVRLKMKPSKRDLVFSEKELLDSVDNYRLESFDHELQERFPNVKSMKINNTTLTPEEVCAKILEEFKIE
ncbi:MAG: hypothetical protein RR554_01425 [Vagococcus sp.]|uniref:hypothetical protein n=1 Tax=Vagococcus sp. TaxID=1933889 RepID=UPI002FCBA6F8